MLRITRKIVLVGVILTVISVSAGASSIAHRDIFVGASARAVGMGSAFTAGPSANNGFLWNPSSLGFMDGAEVNMSGMPVSGGASSSEQAFSVAANPNTLGITDRNFGNLSFATWLDGWGSNVTESTQIVLFGYGLAFGDKRVSRCEPTLLSKQYTYQNEFSMERRFRDAVCLPIGKMG